MRKSSKKGDYLYAVVHTHPFSTKHGYVLLHRIIMENHLERLLNSNEVVHHKNHNKKDNRIENLELLDKRYNTKLHRKEHGKVMVDMVCPMCRKFFSKRKKSTFLAKKNGIATFCSRKCNGLFSRKIQLHGKTPEMEAAISGNIVRIYTVHDNPEQT